MPGPVPPRAVVFDVGRVLARWQPEALYARLVPDPQARAALFARADLEGMNAAGDHGRLDEAVEAQARRHPQDAALIRAWREGWREMFGPQHDATAALLRRLRAQGVPALVLSNFAADTWPEAQEVAPVLREFDGGVISGHEGTAKPDPRIYALLEARAGLSGADLFFTDDKPENIEAARARGWRTHLYEGGEAGAGPLAEALRAEGLPL